MTKLSRRKMAAIVILLCAVSAIASPAQTFTVVYDFHGIDGNNPANEALVQGRDGNLYGTTTSGGTFSDATAFRITPTGALSAYNFDGTNGSDPLAGLVLGTDGLLYGTTNVGGASNDGVVFSSGPQSPIAVVWSFNGTNGSQPQAALTLGVDGDFYGGTIDGGAYNFGTIFKLTASGTQTVLHSFDSLVFSQSFPGTEGSLVYGPDLAFYGVTFQGGSQNSGTIFRITSSGSFKTIYDFGANGSNLAHPVTTLLLANDGNLYGTTSSGGDFSLGTIFQLNPTTDTVTVLHSFDGTDGSGPTGSLVQATDGNLYATTNTLGAFGYGNIYSITTGGILTVLHSFDGTDGVYPWGLLQHTNGE